MGQKGFFTQEEVEDIEKVPPTKKWNKTRRKTEPCEICGLYKDCLSPKMKPTGKGREGILVIAEAPGEEEDEEGRQLVGKVGRFLEKKMKGFGLSLHIDCRKINAINCRPPDNRAPTPEEVSLCRGMVWKEIRRFKPKAIFLFGGSALDSFLAHRMVEKPGGIFRWRGWKIPDRTTKAWVFPMYHPSFVTRNEGNSAEAIFDRDLRSAIVFSGKRFPKMTDEKEFVQVLYEEKEIIKRLRGIVRRKPVIAVDYETTGLKPYRKGHKIYSCSVADSETSAISFLYSRRLKEYWLEIMLDKYIPKLAQNLKFERVWTRTILGKWPEGIVWDPMLASHVLDNREGITGLKHQVYINFGVLGYDEYITPYLKGVEKDANSFNRIDQADPHKLLMYGGLDALYTYKLAKKQIGAMGWQAEGLSFL